MSIRVAYGFLNNAQSRGQHSCLKVQQIIMDMLPKSQSTTALLCPSLQTTSNILDIFVAQPIGYFRSVEIGRILHVIGTDVAVQQFLCWTSRSINIKFIRPVELGTLSFLLNLMLVRTMKMIIYKDATKYIYI